MSFGSYFGLFFQAPPPCRGRGLVVTFLRSFFSSSTKFVEGAFYSFAFCPGPPNAYGMVFHAYNSLESLGMRAIEKIIFKEIIPLSFAFLLYSLSVSLSFARLYVRVFNELSSSRFLSSRETTGLESRPNFCDIFHLSLAFTI